ncbi:DNA-binding protein [Agrobacterium tumefaciens]|nr:phage antirepressor KilAC domain-containing protein [Agrobacterium tumefaciens]TQN59584.1 DNA-binding protein [Agrobacterium tumefaciens]
MENSSKRLPVQIAGVEVNTDAEGRYNLNALHKASGLGEEKAPAKWLRNKAALALVVELENETGQNCLVSVEGRNGGTFAHELLVVSYAGWISPSFQLKVNQAFLDMKAGKVGNAAAALNDPASLRQLLLDNVEKVLALESKVEEMKPAVEALEQIAEAHGSFSRTEAAKHLGVPPHVLIKWLRTNGWTYHRPGSKDDLAYQSKINAGYLEHKVAMGPRPDGTEWVSTQIRVTPKGLTVLAKAFPGSARAA